MKPIPTLSFEEGRPVLVIDGRPTLLFAGELHNSSASSLEYMEREVWLHLRELHLNAVIAPVCWESLEPRPGEFDFALVDGLLSLRMESTASKRNRPFSCLALPRR